MGKDERNFKPKQAAQRHYIQLFGAKIRQDQLGSPTPHQAPQRRAAHMQNSQQAKKTSAFANEMIVPGNSPRVEHLDRIEHVPPWMDSTFAVEQSGPGVVPRLLSIVEPRVVWHHMHSFPDAREAKHCIRTFFNGRDASQAVAHGVYEGSYWKLLAEVDELQKQLLSLSRAPEAAEIPVLSLPAGPKAPRWETFAPVLQPIQENPILPPLVLPSFRKPPLQAEPTFAPPPLKQIPFVPATAGEDTLPEYMAPVKEEVPSLKLPELSLPDPPVLPPRPPPYVPGVPKHGEDWTGERPRQLPVPTYSRAVAEEVPELELPMCPGAPPTLAQLLAAEGLDPCLRPTPEAPEFPPVVPTEETILCVPLAPSHGGTPATALSMRRTTSSFAASFSRKSSRRSSAEEQGRDAFEADMCHSLATAGPNEAPCATPEEEEYPDWWDKGPKEPSNAEFVPPEFIPPDDLEPEMSPWIPTVRIPTFQHPCEPRPVGFLRGKAPVILIDVSGTLAPVLRGRFQDELAAAAALLGPHGEISTQQAFDVITFATGAHSWSQEFSRRNKVLEEGKVMLAGRQVGDLPKPGTVPENPARPEYGLQPVNIEALKSASDWVRSWPEARGHTNLLSALSMCRERWDEIDSILLFSDGIVHDAAAVLDLARSASVEAGAAPERCIPPVHCIGFFAQDRGTQGPAFLEALAQQTKGTFQEYSPTQSHVYAEGELQPFDPKSETPEDRQERLWVEGRLRVERAVAVQSGRHEGIDKALSRVRTAWHMERLLPVQSRQSGRSEYEQQCLAVAERNKRKIAAAREQQYCDALAEWKLRVAEERQEYEAAAASHAARRRAWLSEAHQRRAVLAAAAADAAAEAAVTAAAAADVAACITSRASTASAYRARTSRGGGSRRITADSASGDGAAATATQKTARRQSSSRRVSRQSSKGSTAGSRSAVRAAERAAAKAVRAAERARDRAAQAQARCAAPHVSVIEAAENALQQLEQESLLPPKAVPVHEELQREWEAKLKEVRIHNHRWKKVEEQCCERWRVWKAQRNAMLTAAICDHYLYVVPGIHNRNSSMEERALAEFSERLKRVHEQNEQTRVKHAEEVEQHNEAVSAASDAQKAWQASVWHLKAGFTAECKDLRKSHDTTCTELKAVWLSHKKLVDKDNSLAEASARRRHAEKVAEVQAANAEKREHHAKTKSEAKKVEKENQKAVKEAEVAHEKNLKRIRAANQVKVDEARKEWELEAEAARAQHERLVTVIREELEAENEAKRRTNDVLLEKHRAQWQEAVALAEAEWEAEKLRLTEAYETALKAAQDHNEKIKPAVETAKAAAQELSRVVAFLAVVRARAAKASLGVNYIPGAPNLDRVVEMATLTSALEAAYPELLDPAMDSPVAQCEAIPWPVEAWTTRAPHGTSCAASVRKTRAALAQIHAVECGYKVAATNDHAVTGRKRPKSAVCSGQSYSLEQHGTSKHLTDVAVATEAFHGIKASVHFSEDTSLSRFHRCMDGFNEPMGQPIGRSQRKRPQSAPLQHKPALLRAGDAHAATRTRHHSRTVSGRAMNDECRPGQGPERASSVSAPLRRRGGGGKYGPNCENTCAQSTEAQAIAGKLGVLDHVGRRFMRTASRTPGAGSQGNSCHKDGCMKPPQTLKNSPQTVGRKPRPVSAGQTRARFFYGEAVGRIRYPEIDITTY